MEILDWKQILSPRGYPITGGRALTLRAMPVLAGIVGDVVVAAFGATGHMPAERLGPAGFDG